MKAQARLRHRWDEAASAGAGLLNFSCNDTWMTWKIQRTMVTTCHDPFIRAVLPVGAKNCPWPGGSSVDKWMIEVREMPWLEPSTGRSDLGLDG